MRREVYESLLDRLTPRVREAFEAGIDQLANAQDVAALERAIEAGDVAAALDVLDLDPALLDDLAEELRNVFREGGVAQAEANGENRRAPPFAFRFAMGNVLAQRAAAQRAGNFIVEILEGARETARQQIVAGLARGENPKTTALDIVGRIQTGAPQRRVGGAIGLHSRFRAYADSAAAELASLDANYLTRAARDRRFDATVKRAIREGRALPAETQRKIITRYRARLLRIRGEAIARTEAIGALNAGRHEATRQLVEERGIDADLVAGIWSDSRDHLVRDLHRAMNGQRAPWPQPFEAPNGDLLRFPGDGSLGADPKNIVRCRCFVEWRVSWLEWGRRVDAAAGRS